MTPADPVWFVAEILASAARMMRERRRRRIERQRLDNLLPGVPGWAMHPLLGRLAGPPQREPERLPDLLYARVQAALVEFSRRRDILLTDRSAAAKAVAGERILSWQVEGRDVTVIENHRPLFRARWSSLEGGWRLFWTRNSERWWPHVNGSHLSIGSFESCVREVEQDPLLCFPPSETQLQN
jgi:hypothetical protein